MKKKKRKFTKQQVAIIQRKISDKRKERETVPIKSDLMSTPPKESVSEDIFPKEFPFWARLRMDKQRTTLVIDEDLAKDDKKKLVDGYVHREATHTYHKDFEKIEPNPDKDDDRVMYLKRPRKLPKYMFSPHNKKLEMPIELKQRYEKNNHKTDK